MFISIRSYVGTIHTHITVTLWLDTLAADGASNTVRLNAPGMTARIGFSFDTYVHWLVLNVDGMAFNCASAEAAEAITSRVIMVTDSHKVCQCIVAGIRS